MDAVRATSRIPDFCQVKKRDRKHSGEKIVVRVPLGARTATVDVSGKPRRCFIYKLPVASGKYVVVYVHPEKQQTPLHGKTIVGTFSLFDEQLGDGRRYLAVHISESTGEATHVFRVVPDPLPPRYSRPCHKVFGLGESSKELSY
jgi:hypothetical protein